MKNKIEMKDRQPNNNVEVIDIFVNDKFYTAMVGIRIGNIGNHYRKYKFIHEGINEVIDGDEYPDRLFATFKDEMGELDDYELTNFLTWD